MACLAISLQPVNGRDIVLQRRALGSPSSAASSSPPPPSPPPRPPRSTPSATTCSPPDWASSSSVLSHSTASCTTSSTPSTCLASPPRATASSIRNHPDVVLSLDASTQADELKAHHTHRPELLLLLPCSSVGGEAFNPVSPSTPCC